MILLRNIVTTNHISNVKALLFFQNYRARVQKYIFFVFVSSLHNLFPLVSHSFPLDSGFSITKIYFGYFRLEEILIKCCAA